MTARHQIPRIHEQERADLEAVFEQLAALAPEHFRPLKLSGVPLAITVKRKDRWRSLIWHNYNPEVAAIGSFEAEDTVLGSLFELADKRGWVSSIFINRDARHPQQFAAVVYTPEPNSAPPPMFYANNRALAVARAVVYALTAPGEPHQGEGSSV